MPFLRSLMFATALFLPTAAYADTQKTDAEKERVFFATAKSALDSSMTPAARDDADDECAFHAIMAKAARDYDIGGVETFAQR